MRRISVQINTGWQDQTVEQYLKKELQLTAAQISQPEVPFGWNTKERYGMQSD